MRFQKFSFLILILFFSLQNSFGQSVKTTEVDAVKYFEENRRWYNEFTEHWFQFFDIPEEEIRQSILQFEKISNDLKSSNNSWEGTYGNGGETHGNYIHWSENNGFLLLVVNKCNGGPTQIIRGKVAVTNALVRLIPEKIITASFHHGNHNKETQDKPIELVFVKWRGKRFLIFTNQVTNFADYTAGLNPATSGLYDEGWYFSEVLKEETGSVNELPIFPVEYENYVKKPFKATISSLGKSFRRKKPPISEDADEYEKEIVKNYDDLVTQLKLNIGKNVNLYPNIFIRFARANEDDYSTDGIKIVKVFDDYSIGEYVTLVPKNSCKKSDFERCEAEQRRVLKAGMKVSTTGEW